ncbi:MAG: 5'/3'-nucleotidase SurE [Salinirussus sp.]
MAGASQRDGRNGRVVVEILLTNDDGIDAPGLHALATALEAVGDVTVIAPAENQSAVGRGLSYGRMGPDESMNGTTGLRDGTGEPFTVHIPHEKHDLGYAIHGTPCDCVILGIGTFDPDVVVSGCNAGANLGIHVLPRSGTASAAAEAASLGRPAVAVSMDVIGLEREAEDDFERAARIGAELVDRAVGDGAFEHAEYFNVNVPRPDRPVEGLSVTRPTQVYDMHADLADGRFSLHNPLWADFAAGDIPDDPGTDRRALLNDNVSISPLTLPRSGIDDTALETLGALFEDVVS